MTHLDDEAKRIIAQASEADVAPDVAQARIWQRLSQHLDGPMAPTAAAAHQALGASDSTGLFSGVFVKLGLATLALGALGAAITWQIATRAPERVNLRQTQRSELAVPVPEHEAPPPSQAAVPAPAEPHTRAPVSTAQRPKSAGSALDAEASLIAEAQRELNAAAPARALALLARHRAQFPRGALAPERDAAQVFALCALGRKADALKARKRFLHAFPDSPLAARVRAECSP